MNKKALQDESMKLQWNFYERAINNYSIIMRIMSNVEEDLLVSYIPKVFVEESFFDMCNIMIDDEGIAREGFYSIDDALGNLDYTSVSTLNGNACSPSLVDNVFGYGILYIYPLKKDLRVMGYMVLGKRYQMDIEARLLRELEIVCEIYNKSLLLGQDSHSRSLQSSTIFASALEAFPDPFLLIDRKGYICYANKKAKTQFEDSKGFLVGERVDRVIPGIPKDFAKKNSVLCGEIHYSSKNEFKIYKMESFVVVDETGTGDRRAVVFRDVMEKRVSDEQNLLAKKMESVGMLAGGIAHDFNNMLTGILGYASLMKKLLADDAKLGRYADAIEHSAQRASQLTRHLLNFSRRQKKSLSVVDVNALLEDVIFLLKESFRDIKIVVALDNALPHVKGNEAELQNVFLNLLMNARDAMGNGGMLKVATTKRKSGEGREHVVITFEDTGKGIDELLLHKVFEPYFSTKDSVSNLGMGLYLVDRAVKDHGGFIEVSSERGHGTAFSVYIPVPVRPLTAKKEKAVAEWSSVIRDRSILIVDDEDLIRELLKGSLAEADNIAILEAGNGEDALALFREYGNSIDLVILDMIMPGIKGDEVLKKIREARHDVKVIISSGYMSEEQREKLKIHRVEGFLDKPFKQQEVLEMIAEVLSCGEG